MGDPDKSDQKVEQEGWRFRDVVGDGALESKTALEVGAGRDRQGGSCKGGSNGTVDMPGQDTRDIAVADQDIGQGFAVRKSHPIQEGDPDIDGGMVQADDGEAAESVKNRTLRRSWWFA
ncbi:hypothetical protein [Sinomonas atrocyanea]